MGDWDAWGLQGEKGASAVRAGRFSKGKREGWMPIQPTRLSWVWTGADEGVRGAIVDSREGASPQQPSVPTPAAQGGTLRMGLERLEMEMALFRRTRESALRDG